MQAVLLLSCFTDEEIEVQRSEVTCPKPHSWEEAELASARKAFCCVVMVAQASVGPGAWALGAARGLTDVHGVGVGERLGRQDGVLQSFLVVGGWWLIVGIVFHRRLVLLIGGLIVTVILPILIVIGTFIVIFFLPTQ